jgi:hypothetical protein
MALVDPEDKVGGLVCFWLGDWTIPLIVEDWLMGCWAWIGVEYGGAVIIICGL